MKPYLTFCMLMLFSLSFALPKDQPGSMDKMMHSAFHNAGSLSLEATNWAYTKDLVENKTNLYLMNKGAPWISAKRPRRNTVGELLYWLYPIPSDSHPETVTQTDSLWNPDLKVVLDSLTTVGYDGEDDLYELLPAYNPYSAANPDVQYEMYNVHDVVLKSILGLPSPRPFEIPDPLGTYCFSYNQGNPFDTPGFETLSAYLYDYCPFGTQGERDYGRYHNYSTHYPLGIAIHRESYAWPIQNYDRMIVFKNTIYNTSTVDTLYDVAIGECTDNDIGPLAFGSTIAVDDINGYIKGTGNEFAYTRDYDGDSGLSTIMIAQKIYIPDTSLNHAAWCWRLGLGPNDRDPRNLNPMSRTSNEKYWLATGRNSDNFSITALRPVPSDIIQYEQLVSGDTRIFNTVFGAVPTVADPNPAGRLHLPPLQSLSYYVVYFVGDSFDELMNTSQAIEGWIDNGFDLGNVSNLTCLPYLYDPLVITPSILQINWASYSNPDHFEVIYKPYNEPASQWTSINLSGSIRNHTLPELDPSVWYHIKVASKYYEGVNEIYLESQTKLVCINNIMENEYPVNDPLKTLVNYPNPFSPSTTVELNLDKASELELCIYNLKGQLVKVLSQGWLNAGINKLQWDGKDAANQPCASGVYYLRLKTSQGSKSHKILLMK